MFLNESSLITHLVHTNSTSSFWVVQLVLIQYFGLIPQTLIKQKFNMIKILSTFSL